MSGEEGSTKSSIKGGRNKSNKKISLNNNFKDGLLAIKNLKDVQDFISQFNLGSQGKKYSQYRNVETT